jgi:cobalt-zinc-cadmium efflux system protein
MRHGHSHNHSHSHNHNHSSLTGRNLFISILLNILITVAQVIGGLISGSLSLLSDALHNFSDVVSLIISYIANRLAGKKASINKTFGYKRAEILAAFINASTLSLVAVLLIIEAIKRFQNPQVIESSLVIWLSLLGILANGFSVFLLKKDADTNMNMRSAYLHLLTDMLASVAVLIGGLLMQFYQLYWVDSLLTLLIALYLIWVGFDLLKESFKVLMLFTPDAIPVEAIVEEIQRIKEIKNVHHIHVWQLNEDEIHFEAHIDFERNITLLEFDVILNKVEELLYHKFEISHVTIQPEFGKCGNKEIIVQD